jgi:hypothetical protein
MASRPARNQVLVEHIAYIHRQAFTLPGSGRSVTIGYQPRTVRMSTQGPGAKHDVTTMTTDQLLSGHGHRGPLPTPYDQSHTLLPPRLTVWS